MRSKTVLFPFISTGFFPIIKFYFLTGFFNCHRFSPITGHQWSLAVMLNWTVNSGTHNNSLGSFMQCFGSSQGNGIFPVTMKIAWSTYRPISILCRHKVKGLKWHIFEKKIFSHKSGFFKELFFMVLVFKNSERQSLFS